MVVCVASWLPPEAIRCGGMLGKAIMGDNEGEAVKTSDRAGESSPPDELCGICVIVPYRYVGYECANGRIRDEAKTMLVMMTVLCPC